MAFSMQNASEVRSEINVVPLVDVLLVLLIIFMVAAPVLSGRIDLDLPQPGPVAKQDPPTIRLRIDALGQLSWNGAPLPAAALAPQFELEAGRDPQPLLEVETSPEAHYQAVAEVLGEARSAGIEKIGFVENR